MRTHQLLPNSLAHGLAAIVAIALTAPSGIANQIFVPVANPVSPMAVDVVPSVERVPGKDYTDSLDMTHVPTPHAVLPSQLGMFDGLGGAQDGLLLGDFNSNLGEFHVDAQSQVNDALFDAVTINRAPLIISASFDSMLGRDVALAAERTGGSFEAFATRTQVVGHPHNGGTLRDIDSVDLWGPDGEPHAGFYSFESDPGNTSIFAHVALAPGGIVPYISSTQIAAAIGDREVADLIDVDGLMVRDRGTGFNPFDGEFNDGDAVMFSIEPIINADGTVRYDGGEIWVWEFGQAAQFLKHGGHTWDTAFDVASALGINTQNIDALEAAGAVPEPTSMILGMAGLLAVVILRRR